MPMDELGVALYNIMLELDDRILLRYVSQAIQATFLSKPNMKFRVKSSIHATKLQMS